MAELALLIMLFLESDIFLTEDWDVDDVIILSFDDKEFDIWDSCPESFLFSDDPDGIGISKDIWKIKYLIAYKTLIKLSELNHYNQWNKLTSEFFLRFHVFLVFSFFHL